MSVDRGVLGNSHILCGKVNSDPVHECFWANFSSQRESGLRSCCPRRLLGELHCFSPMKVYSDPGVDEGFWTNFTIFLDESGLAS